MRAREIGRLSDPRRGVEPMADRVAKKLGPRPLRTHVEQRPRERRAQSDGPRAVAGRQKARPREDHELRLHERRREHQQPECDRQRNPRVGRDARREPGEDRQRVDDAEEPTDRERPPSERATAHTASHGNEHTQPSSTQGQTTRV